MDNDTKIVAEIRPANNNGDKHWSCLNFPLHLSSFPLDFFSSIADVGLCLGDFEWEDRVRMKSQAEGMHFVKKDRTSEIL
jgi:hypothetical protein